MRYILILSLLFNVPCYSQDPTEVVNVIVNEVCQQLNTIEDITQLSSKEAQQLIVNTKLRHQEEWNKGLALLPNSQNNGKNVFDYLLFHRLGINCPIYPQIASLVDRTLVGDSSKRELYLTTKNFFEVITFIKNNDESPLTLLFDPSLHRNKLNKQATLAMNEFNAYKDTSFLLIFPTQELKFYASLTDFTSGEEKLVIIFEFKDTSDWLIDGWEIRTNEVLKIEAEKRAKKAKKKKHLRKMREMEDNISIPTGG